MRETDERHPFEVARENDKRVNRMLSDTDGAVAVMEYTGAIGYHIHIATGETEPEYIWKVALLQALDDVVFEMAYVDADTPVEAREQLEWDLKDAFQPLVAEAVADEFESNLSELIETQEDIEHDRTGEKQGDA